MTITNYTPLTHIAARLNSKVINKKGKRRAVIKAAGAWGGSRWEGTCCVKCNVVTAENSTITHNKKYIYFIRFNHHL